MDTIFSIESEDKFQEALRKVICSYHSSSHDSPTSEDCTMIREAKYGVMKLLSVSNYDTNKISELLAGKAWDEMRIAFFVNLLNEKKTEFLYSSLIQQYSVYGETVTNFDWIVKLVLGSSELNILKYPLLQLILFTDTNGVHKKILYDVNKDMLLRLINILENQV